MYKALWLKQAAEYALIIIAFAIPLSYLFTSYAVIAFLTIWLIQANFKAVANNINTRKVLWLWIAFYLLHVVSYFYSIDKNEASFDLGRKMSFIVFPVVIGAGTEINKKTLQRIFLGFIISVSLLAVYSLFKAGYTYHTTGKTDQFFYHRLVEEFDANAVYCSLYTLFSITVLLFFPFTFRFNRILKTLLVITQILFFLLLSARTLIILFFAIILPYYIIISLLRKKKGILYSIVLFVLFLVPAIIIFKTDNPIKKRYTDVFKGNIVREWTTDYKTDQKKEFNNLSLRIFLWQIAIDNVKEHNYWLTGAGNGSVTALQNKKMDEYGVKNIYNEKDRSPLYNINVHNMYLQTLAELGIPGLLLLLSILGSAFYFIYRSDLKETFFIFNLTIAVLMLQESSMETQAGIIYYTFFTMLFYSYYYFRKVGNSEIA